MESRAFAIQLEKNPLIAVRVTPGHFTTSNAHTNNYLDVSELKSDTAIARDVAREIAIPYLSTTLIDTIVCMEKMEVIGAYLAQELAQDGTSVMNTGKSIHVVSPVNNAYGKLIFPDSAASWIHGKNVLILIATVSSGRSLGITIECVNYYGGNVMGVSALYRASEDKTGINVNCLFTSDVIPGYKLFKPADCEMCKKGEKLEGIISYEGYAKIE